MSTRSSVLTEESLTDLNQRFGSIVSVDEDWIAVPRSALSSSEEDGTVTVPRELNSIATLKFLGLSKRGAENTWNRYKQFLEVRHDDIINFALGTAKGGHDTFSVDDEDWSSAMKSMSISKDLRRRILNPSYKSIRITKTPREWVLETISDRWLGLLSLDDVVLHGSNRPPSRFISLQERSANKQRTKEKAPSQSIDDDCGEGQSLNIKTLAMDRSVAVNEIQLYKGGNYDRMMTAFRTSKDGTLQNVTLRLASTPPTDFSRAPDCTYWTKNAEVAEKCAGWARNRNNLDMDAGILNMIIPKKTFECAVQFYSREHWQEFIWINTLDIDMPDYLAYLKSGEALVGPILCEARAGVVRKFEAGDHWSCLDADKLMSGSKAMQIMFKGEKIHAQLDSEARLWLDLWTNEKAPQKKSAD